MGLLPEGPGAPSPGCAERGVDGTLPGSSERSAHWKDWLSGPGLSNAAPTSWCPAERPRDFVKGTLGAGGCVYTCVRARKRAEHQRSGRQAGVQICAARDRPVTQHSGLF